MRRSAILSPMRSSIRFALLATALAALLGPAAAGARQATKVVAKQAQNATLSRTILTTTKGRTLYSLSAETKWQVHLHRLLPRHLAPPGRPGRGEAERAGEARHDRTAGRQDPGHLQRAPPLQLRRRLQGGRSERRGDQGRRHLARRGHLQSRSQT